MSSSSQSATAERRVLLLDDFRELEEREWQECKGSSVLRSSKEADYASHICGLENPVEKRWNAKNVTFVRYKTGAAGPDAPSKQEAFDRLAKLDKEKGPFSGVVSLAGFLHKYKPIDDDFCQCFPKLGVVTGMGAGYDNIDTEALSAAGVFYCNTPSSVSIPTADSASVLILATLKNTIQADRNVRSGQWTTGLPAGLNPKGAVLGIIGMGSIGRIVCKQMQAFGMHVVYHNRHELSEEEAAGATYISTLPDLLGQSDVVSIHVPLSSATRHFLSTEEFKQFKKGSRLVNTARGPVVDEEALVEALENGQLSGAGLDVFENEPKVHPWLLEADNVLLQPHTGSHTIGTLAETSREMLSNLASFLTVRDGEQPHNAVNKLNKDQLNLKLRIRGQA